MQEKIKVGFIGSGFARATQAPAFALFDEATLFAVASPTARRRERFAADYRIPHAFENWQELIACNPDLICITTPPNTHAEMAIAALEKNVHVICEKPFAMNTTEAENMLRAAETNPLLTIVDHELRLLPAVKWMKKMIAKGTLGDIFSVRAEALFSSRNDPERHWNWWSDRAQGGGALGAVGSHFIDLCHFLIGATESVCAELHQHYPFRPDKNGAPQVVTSDDGFDLMLKFGKDSLAPKKIAVLTATTVESYTAFKFEVSGSLGTLRLLGDGNLYLAQRESAKGGRSTQTAESFCPLQPELDETDRLIASKLQGSALEKQGIFAQAFAHLAHASLKAIREGSRQIEGAATFQDGLHCQKVMDAAHRSAQKQAWETLTLKF
ncbi:oxidoreductase domain protein [Chloroherpeton thalassium ATCC 35110]|uniref:Oxidoreductase domain protein n=1 Tax=Chloroherpeton thalassium (strain ATCC 35110 / GB-78) TaxID=517418 RepID=B3QT57_CHLT3|nr:Gfo/Idh/MocA family oxidoreductase [Chloroherpeton thalassium]ACF14156.1 oxidoreductase domain protein [Chloroherpeton thalassium ATCC 35110]